jgi:hypothetical protein
LLKIAADIQNHFAEGKSASDFTIYGHENNSYPNSEVQIRFSNDDMEDRDDLPSDAVIVDLDRWA